MFNIKALRKDFPILKRRINGKVLTYLDNASTTQKPSSVINAISQYYCTMNANIHRGIHTLSEEATTAYEQTRQLTAKFIGAREAAEIIFTRNATEAINLVAYTWGEQHVQTGDEIVVSALEHHSNLVPWQELCRRKKALLKIIPITQDGTLELDSLVEIITSRTKLVAITQMSNVLGTIVPLAEIIEAAHQVGAKVMVDGAQGVAHMGINAQALDCDFLAFSGHKMLGPSGIGILYGKRELLENMPPFLFGGEMVKEVQDRQASWNELPWKFEAGTPNIADVIAFAEAIRYLEKLGLKNILEHDQKLLAYARKRLSALPGIALYGPTDPAQAGGILSFNIPGVHPHDVGSILNEQGIAIRAGNHCAQPLMRHLGVSATARLSFYFYNTEEEIDLVFKALQQVYQIFKIPSLAS
jgi:cysteine desulfurase/selenocysteine lyase